MEWQMADAKNRFSELVDRACKKDRHYIPDDGRWMWH
jgi:prevent-host-death family protein